jgi:hypothetical protein
MARSIQHQFLPGDYRGKKSTANNDGAGFAKIGKATTRPV